MLINSILQGLREAIKNGDTAVAQKLLNQVAFSLISFLMWLSYLGLQVWIYN